MPFGITSYLIPPILCSDGWIDYADLLELVDPNRLPEWQGHLFTSLAW